MKLPFSSWSIKLRSFSTPCPTSQVAPSAFPPGLVTVFRVSAFPREAEGFSFPSALSPESPCTLSVSLVFSLRASGSIAAPPISPELTSGLGSPLAPLWEAGSFPAPSASPLRTSGLLLSFSPLREAGAFSALTVSLEGATDPFFPSTSPR